MKHIHVGGEGSILSASHKGLPLMSITDMSSLTNKGSHTVHIDANPMGTWVVLSTLIMRVIPGRPPHLLRPILPFLNLLIHS